MTPNWRDELIEAAKSKSERDAEEAARQKKRVEEALGTAETAYGLARDVLRFVGGHLREKGQAAEVTEADSGDTLEVAGAKLGVQLARDRAILRVAFLDTKPREFDFAKDRHIAPSDVEEYVGRRAVELVKVAQKNAPW